MPIATSIISSGSECIRPRLNTRNGEPKRLEIFGAELRTAPGRLTGRAAHPRAAHVPLGIDGHTSVAPSREAARRIEIDHEGVGSRRELTSAPNVTRRNGEHQRQGYQNRQRGSRVHHRLLLQAIVLAFAMTCTLAAGCAGAKGPETNDTAGTPAAAAPAPRAAAPPAQSPAAPPDASASSKPGDGYDEGAALAAAGKFAEARAVFEAASSKDPGEGSLASGVAMLRDLDSGRVSGETVQRIFRGIQHYNAQRSKEAHDDVNEALRLSPEYPRAHEAKATLHVYQGQYTEALEALERALELDPRFADAYYNRGAVRAELKQFDAAIADYDRAIELQPSSWQAYRNRGSAYSHKNDAQAAIDDYTRALELRPRDADTLLLRGVVQAAIDRWDPAMADLTKVIELDPRNAAAYYNRAVGHQQKGELDRAVADYTRAAELDPADPAPLINRGLVYVARREYDRAIGDYDRALKIAPDFALAHYNKGRVFQDTGRQQDAIGEYRAFLEKVGSNEPLLAADTRQRLAELEQQRQE